MELTMTPSSPEKIGSEKLGSTSFQGARSLQETDAPTGQDDGQGLSAKKGATLELIYFDHPKGEQATHITVNALTTLRPPLKWQVVNSAADLADCKGGSHAQKTGQAKDIGASAEARPSTVVVTNFIDDDLLRAIHSALGRCQVAFITNEPFSAYGHLLAETTDLPLGVDHIIAAHSAHSILRELKLIIDKTALMGQDSPSLSDYFFPSFAVMQRFELPKGGQRQPINQAVQKFAESIGMNQMGCRNIFSISEELLMNVMIDAPRESAKLGLTGREQLPATLRCGFDGSTFFICAEDPFGALRRAKFYEYVGKTILRHNPEALLDRKADGAGIGIVRILSGCHGLFCRVKKGFSTEVMATIDSREHLRDLGSMARSLHFYTD